MSAQSPAVHTGIRHTLEGLVHGHARVGVANTGRVERKVGEIGTRPAPCTTASASMGVELPGPSVMMRYRPLAD